MIGTNALSDRTEPATQGKLRKNDLSSVHMTIGKTNSWGTALATVSPQHAYAACIKNVELLSGRYKKLWHIIMVLFIIH